MAGRLVSYYDRIQTTTSGVYLGSNTMPSDVLWKCTTICGYNSTWQPTPISGNEFVTAQLHVNTTAVFEVRFVSPNRASSVLVLPWGDGLRFTSQEVVGWNLATVAKQGVWSASFFGARD